MCGKAAVSHLPWHSIYRWADRLDAPSALPPDPATRLNISPSRLQRKGDPDSITWETLPVTYFDGHRHLACEALWPFLPNWSAGRLPYLKNGQLLATANARLREQGKPFAPLYMPAWRRAQRVVVWVSWFYEFDQRVHPKIPWAVVPRRQSFWPMAALGNRVTNEMGQTQMSVAIITVAPNQTLLDIGHHRSPALLHDSKAVKTWLDGDSKSARALLKPSPENVMEVTEVSMAVKIPGNENLQLPDGLRARAAEGSRRNREAH